MKINSYATIALAFCLSTSGVFASTVIFSYTGTVGSEYIGADLSNQGVSSSHLPFQSGSTWSLEFTFDSSTVGTTGPFGGGIATNYSNAISGGSFTIGSYTASGLSGNIQISKHATFGDYFTIDSASALVADPAIGVLFSSWSFQLGGLGLFANTDLPTVAPALSGLSTNFFRVGFSGLEPGAINPATGVGYGPPEDPFGSGSDFSFYGQGPATAVAVPEPSRVLLLGLTAFGFINRRRRVG